MTTEIITAQAKDFMKAEVKKARQARDRELCKGVNEYINYKLTCIDWIKAVCMFAQKVTGEINSTELVSYADKCIKEIKNL